MKTKQAKYIVHPMDSEYNKEHKGIYFMTDFGDILESCEILVLDEADLIAAKEWFII